jgi:hypothetical protein
MKTILMMLVLALAAVPILADTLYLKNGSVLKGAFVGFENGEFIFELGNGNRMKFRAAEVSRLVLDNDRRDPREGSYPRRDPGGDPVPLPSGGGGGRWEPQPAFDVRLEEQWIRSQIQVRSGQRIRVEASGTITLEGRTQVTPDGLSGRRDPDSPIPDQNDGGLIAAVGQDQSSPLIFVGRSREFVADRDGILYFTINHWETANARGAFRVTVSLDRDSVGSGPVGGGQPPQGQGRTKTITVSATQAWTDTGIDLEPNMTIEIVADGEISISNRDRSGPSGNQNATNSSANYPLRDEPAGALIAKIRYRNGQDSNLVLIGERSTPATEPNESGRLLLGINDDNLRDNRGSYRVTIRY